jgi:methyl-accepting chemotaxis protein
MLRKLGIGSRLILLIAVQAFILLAIGATALFGLDLAARSTNVLNRNVTEGTQLDYVADTLRGDLLQTVYQLNSGAITWAEGRERLAFARTRFEEDWNGFARGVTLDDAEFLRDTMDPGLQSVRTAFEELERLLETEDRSNLQLFVVNEFSELVEPLLNALIASSSQRQLASEETFRRSLEDNQRLLFTSLAVIVVGVLLAAVIGVLIYRSITQPIARIADTVSQVAGGDYSVRSAVQGEDELGQLGVALDALLEDKVQSLARSEREAEQLNDSVLQLLEAVAQMSERDLTVSVPVTPDVAGPVADAINQLAEETGAVLRQVSQIARAVAQAAAHVNRRSAAVNESAGKQRTQIESAARELASASQVLGRIAQLAQQCGDIARGTTETTQSAVETVNGTVSGMNEIRDAIQETGKRIKRLGERSQEITSIVEIINSIAERTHVLALNASMQAAAAGDAGRGFAVVADEVQRLSESSREATAQIAGLIKSIQVDTNDTVVTMDRTIAQVVDGSRMAESAGQRMQETQAATGRLVQAVLRIAAGSQQQAKISAELRDRAQGIVAGTAATAKQLTTQLGETRKMVQYAKALTESVQVFKLPRVEDR